MRQLAQHYHKSPDLITEEELRQYFLYVKNIKQWSRSGSTIAQCGIKFFFEQTLHSQFTTLSLVRPPREKKLPVILSTEEVRKILDCIRLPRYRVCAMPLECEKLVYTGEKIRLVKHLTS